MLDTNNLPELSELFAAADKIAAKYETPDWEKEAIATAVDAETETIVIDDWQAELAKPENVDRMLNFFEKAFSHPDFKPTEEQLAELGQCFTNAFQAMAATDKLIDSLSR